MIGRAEKSPKVICLTPVKNEAWILDRFVQCASLWADHIIIADQQSTDNSREIAQKYPKVILLQNASTQYNELERQQLLIDRARKISGSSLLIALDADECLTANALHSAEWKSILESEPGTVIKFQWVNLSPDIKSCWIPENARVFGFMDDGISDNIGEAIHSVRLPVPPNSSILSLKDIKVLHYQYTDLLRMQSKHRWYQVWEQINYPEKSTITIYRQYHHMYRSLARELTPIEDVWFSGYMQLDIDVTSTYQSIPYWWDIEVIKLFEAHTPQFFRKLSIWDVPWTVGGECSCLVQDPRSRIEKIVHRWLKVTQLLLVEHPKSIKSWFLVKLVSILDKFLIRLRW